MNEELRERAKEIELKTDAEVFQAVIDGRKTFEIRFDDRGFEVGDNLLLRETKYSGEEMKAGAPLLYTGRVARRQIGYILRGPRYGLADGWVIASFAAKEIERSSAEVVELEPLEVSLRDVLAKLLSTAHLTTGVVPRMSPGGFASLHTTGVVTKENIIRVFEKFGVRASAAAEDEQ